MKYLTQLGFGAFLAWLLYPAFGIDGVLLMALVFALIGFCWKHAERIRRGLKRQMQPARRRAAR